MRYNGYAADDLIQSGGLIVESLIRDWIHVELDLEITSKTDTTHFIVTGLKVEINDYYNDAIIVNVTRGGRVGISDYVGSTKTLILSSAMATWDAGDKVFLKNINVSIDTDSIDRVSAKAIETGTTTATTSLKLVDSAQNFTSTVLPGMLAKNLTDGTESIIQAVDSNTTLSLTENIFTSGESYEILGTRGDFILGRCLVEQENSSSILDKLLYEIDCTLFQVGLGQYRLISLGGGVIQGTLDTPLVFSGKASVTSRLTPLSNIFTDFTLNYDYNYMSKTYKKKLRVNKNTSSDSTLDDLMVSCADAEKEYKINQKWEYNADWIKDDTTALRFLRRKINWHTTQRVYLTWTGDIAGHIKYEKGDYVKIDCSKELPSGINNSSIFMITGKTIKKKTVVLNLFA